METLNSGDIITDVGYHYGNKRVNTKYCNGLYIADYKVYKLVATEGGTIGFSNSIIKVPDKNLSVHILTNRNNY